MTTSVPGEARPSALPNVLTLGRLAAAPIVAGLLLWAGHAAFTQGFTITVALYATAFILFVLAALTDWLDGAMARKLAAVTPLGAALDHAADKALVTACLVVLAATSLPLDLVAAAAVILTRDVAVAGLREGLSLSGRALPVSPLGKYKTLAALIGVGSAIALQFVALVLPTADRSLEPVDVVAWITRAALIIAAALALWSGWEYLRAALRRPG